MSEEINYHVELSEGELYSLTECLTKVRKQIVSNCQASPQSQRINSKDNPLFIAACKLQFKLARVENPNTTVTLQDFLNFGDNTDIG